MAVSGADLLMLQANIKKDPEGYKDEFMLQYRNYQALLDIFKLKPSKESKEFGDRVLFMAQVSKCYPKTMAGFPAEIMSLLDTHSAVLDPGLRRTLVQALVLLRNRGQVDPLVVLPLFFRLFRCQDKALRQQLFRHIVSDIKTANKKSRNERLNRSLQNFLYSVVVDDNESAAKRSLAVLTELWRRHVWRDARTVNVIASAAFHKSSRVMLAVMKFFLGQDKDDDGSDADDDDDDDEAAKSKGPSKEEVYKAYNQGTRSSRRKKQAKIKRVMNTVRKQARKEAGAHTESFAAIHLLHDPQTFCERLFSRLQSGSERFETRMAVVSVMSRIIGVHKLLVLNFYPFLQKYIAPHQRDVTVVLAALVQAVHDLVPPETLAPVLKQLVDQFVHDKARPEVMTVGIKAVRELCLRCPLVMNEDLLQDLAEYRKFRDKEVSSAARSLISLFREINPEMLAKKDRGRGADLALKPRAYGEATVHSRVEGAELLEQALARGQGSDEDDFNVSDDDDDDEGSEGDDEGGEGEESDEGDEQEEGEEGWQDVSSGEGEEAGASGEDEDEDEEGGEDDESSSEYDSEEEQKQEEGRRAGDGASTSGSEDDEDNGGQRGKRGDKKRKLQPEAGSLAALKKKLAEAQARKKAKSAGGGEEQGGAEGSEEPAKPAVPIEMERILTQEDFERIKRLKHKAMIEAAFAKHGLKSSMSAAKKRRLVEAAEAEAEEAEALEAKLAHITEAKINPDDLKGRHKRRKDKEERLASVLAGREGRDKFGSSAGLKKCKTGGLSEKEKQKRKQMPIAARIAQLRKRSNMAKERSRGKKNFRGHVRG